MRPGSRAITGTGRGREAGNRAAIIPAAATRGAGRRSGLVESVSACREVAGWAAGSAATTSFRRPRRAASAIPYAAAQPILDALKNPLPEAFANLYVIGVRDFPLLDDRRRSQDDDDSDSTTASKTSKDAIDNLKQYTLLQPKGRESVEARLVQQMTPGGTYFLFGFSKAQLDFGKNDHEVDFSTRLGRLLVKAKFDMTEMKYHKKLAV